MSAYDFEVGGIYYNILQDAAEPSCEVTSGDNQYSGDVVVPETVTNEDVTYNVTGIGVGAFRNCEELKSVLLPSTIKAIGVSAFERCLRLETVNLPDGITEIADATFSGCSWNLKNISIPESVTRIGNDAFRNCSNSLASIVIPQNVTTIGENAFRNCQRFKNITIPANVVSVGVNAFGECPNLSFITCEAVKPPVFAVDDSYDEEWKDLVFKNATLYVPSGAVDSYKAAEGWSKFLTIMNPPIEVNGLFYNVLTGNTCEVAPSGSGYSGAIVVPENITVEGVTYTVTSVGARAFKGCAELKSVLLPHTIKAIGVNAFEDCSLLETVNLPEGITEIADATFSGCDWNLRSINIPESVTRIGKSAFERCFALTTIAIPQNVTTIDEYAFSQCYGIKSITIPANVVSIGVNAFKECRVLTSVTCEGTTPPAFAVESNEDEYRDCVFKNATLYVPIGTIDAYKAAEGWSKFQTIKNRPVEVDGLFYSILTENICEVTSNVSGYSGDIVVPETITYNGVTYTVTGIAAKVFKDCWELKGVSLPATITTIGESAFYNCQQLRNITIPENVTSVGMNALGGCGNMTSITCEGTTPPAFAVESNEDEYRDCVFKNATLYVPLGTIEAYKAAEGWSKFQTIKYPPVESDGVFYNILTENTCEVTSNVNVYSGDIVVPETITSEGVTYTVTGVAAKAFEGCEKLKSISLPATLTAIGEKAFYNCHDVTRIIIPENAQITEIAEETFHCCWRLTDFSIPSSVTNIAKRAFYECYDMQSITLPKALKTIGEETFWNCANLKAITIPENVTSVGLNAFSKCGALTSITFEGTTPPAFAVDGNEDEYRDRVFKNVILNVPTGTIDAYKAAEGWSKFLTIHEPAIVVDGITYYAIDGNTCEVGAGAEKYTGEVVIPSEIIAPNTDKKYQVVAIGHSAFANCNELRSVNIPSTVTSIDNRAFMGCHNLGDIEIPSSVTSIGEEAFLECGSFDNIVIPASVTSIGLHAFANCSLTSITVESPTPPAFAGDESGWSENLFKNTILYVPNGTVDAYKAADGWSKFQTILNPPVEVDGLLYNLLTDNTCEVSPNENGYSGDIVVPESITVDGVTFTVTGVAAKAFEDCKELKTVSLPATITTIGERAFRECWNVTSITIPEEAEITEIAEFTFRGCSQLAGFTIPQSVTNIGRYAFYECHTLTQITLPASVTHIGYMALYFYSLNTVTCKSAVPPTCDDEVFIPSRCAEMTLYVPEESKEAYTADATWGQFGKIMVPPTLYEGVYYNLYDADMTCEVTVGEQRYTGNIVIPSTITVGEGDDAKVYTVIAIGPKVFYGNTELTDITIPATVTTIGEEAFRECEGIKSVTCEGTTPPNGADFEWAVYNNAVLTVPAGSKETYKSCAPWSYFSNIMEPTAIDEQGVWYRILSTEDKTCAVVAAKEKYAGDIVIPETVTYKGEEYAVTGIDNYAFRACAELRSVVIGNNVISIGDRAFSDDDLLTSVTFGENVETIGQNVFSWCQNVETIICLGTTPASAGEFDSDIYSATLYVPEAAKASYMADEVWGKFKKVLTSTDEFYAGGWFYRILSKEDNTCELVTASSYDSAVEVPSKVTYNGGLYQVVKIGENTFNGCTRMSSVQLPTTITEIAGSSVAGCENLQTIICLGTTPPTCTDGFSQTVYENVSLNVPATAKEVYSKTAPWSNFSNIAANTKFIVDEFMYEIRSDEEGNRTCAVLAGEDKYSGDIVVPETVKYDGKTYTVVAVGEQAFYGCTELTSVKLPDTVQEIGNQAFAESGKLTSVNLPEGITSLTGAFSGCNSLAEITLPNSLTELGNNSFGFCKSLTSVHIPDGVTQIGNSALGWCTNLKEVNIPESVTSIGHYAFACTAITSIVVPEGVTSLSGTFLACKSLSEVKLPKSLTTIGIETFESCSSLTSVEIPDNVTTIDSYAFSRSAIEEITIPKNVTSISKQAFQYTNLQAVYSLATTPPDGFENTFGTSEYENATLYVPAGTVADYQAATAWKNFLNIQAIEELTFTALSEDEKVCVVSIGEHSTLTEVVIPETVVINGETYTVVAIADGAFKNSDITSVEIPATVTSIGADAFTGCEDITVITCKSVTPPTYESGFEQAVYAKAVLMVPTESETLYASQSPWNLFGNINTGTGIGNIAAGSLSVTVNGNQIVVGGLSENERVALYDATGVKFAEAIAINGTATFDTSVAGKTVVIVKASSKVAKFMVKK